MTMVMAIIVSVILKRVLISIPTISPNDIACFSRRIDTLLVLSLQDNVLVHVALSGMFNNGLNILVIYAVIIL